MGESAAEAGARSTSPARWLVGEMILEEAAAKAAVGSVLLTGASPGPVWQQEGKRKNPRVPLREISPMNVKPLKISPALHLDVYDEANKENNYTLLATGVSSLVADHEANVLSEEEEVTSISSIDGDWVPDEEMALSYEYYQQLSTIEEVTEEEDFDADNAFIIPSSHPTYYDLGSDDSDLDPSPNWVSNQKAIPFPDLELHSQSIKALAVQELAWVEAVPFPNLHEELNADPELRTPTFTSSSIGSPSSSPQLTPTPKARAYVPVSNKPAACPTDSNPRSQCQPISPSDSSSAGNTEVRIYRDFRFICHECGRVNEIYASRKSAVLIMSDVWGDNAANEKLDIGAHSFKYPAELLSSWRCLCDGEGSTCSSAGSSPLSARAGPSCSRGSSRSRTSHKLCGKCRLQTQLTVLTEFISCEGTPGCGFWGEEKEVSMVERVAGGWCDEALPMEVSGVEGMIVVARRK